MQYFSEVFPKVKQEKKTQIETTFVCSWLAANYLYAGLSYHQAISEGSSAKSAAGEASLQSSLASSSSVSISLLFH